MQKAYKTDLITHNWGIMRAITFKLEEELLEKLDLFCANHKIDRSVVIRKAIESYLKNVTEGY